MKPTSDNGQYVIARVEAQRSATLIQVAAVLGAGVCIALAAGLQNPINQQRQELNLVMQSEIYKELPPKYVLVSALGGVGRAVLADFLWMRAETLKQEGEYHEAHQLSKAICTLQPRFPQVWVYHAWNMAYNISVGTHTPQERWQWVYNGIRLLRDEGIPNNERVVPIYRELGWILLHKIGDRMDDKHHFYKRQWAAMMETVLGPPPAATSNAEAIDWFRPIAGAPRSLDALIENHAGVSDLVAELGGLGVDVEVGTDTERIYHPLEVKFFRPYMRYLEEQDLSALRSKPKEQTDQQRALAGFFAASEKGEDFRALLAYLRSKVLREQYKMDPGYMLAMTGKLGTAEPIPIDWRTPWGHVLYWAMYGVEKGKKNLKPDEHQQINTDRNLLNALTTLAVAGQYAFRLNLDEPMESFLAPGPDLRYVEAMHNMYIRLGKEYADEGENVDNITCEALRSGHVNHLESSIVSFYLVGADEEAQKWVDYLAKYYKNPHTGEIQDQYLRPLADFVRDRLPDIKESYLGVNRLILTQLHRAYIAMASGEDAKCDDLIRRAAKVYEGYQEDMGSDTVDGRLKLHEFPQLRAIALRSFLANINPSLFIEGASPYPLPVRMAVWEAEDNRVKQYCYDLVISHLRRECEKEGIDVNQAFPEPKDMEEWRKEHPERRQQEDPTDEPEDRSSE